MSGLLLLGSRQGVQILERQSGNWRSRAERLPEKRVTALTARGSLLLAGTRQGIFRSEDLGDSWSESSRGLDTTHVRAAAFFPETPGTALAGTQPAGIFLSKDAGKSWHRRPEIDRLREEGNWSLPYAADTGCVRSFAFSRARAFAAVEQGGVLVSDDFGLNWRLVAGSTGTTDTPQPEGYIHPDVHSIKVHPAREGLLLAPCGGGLYRSDSGGQRWRSLYDCYCRAVWADPNDPDRLLLGPADRVNRNGRIEISVDGGEKWHSASRGLEVPWPRTLVNQFVTVGQQLLALLSDGRVFASKCREEFEWSLLPAADQPILTAAWMPAEQFS